MAVAEGTELSFDCIHNLRAGFAHMCKLYGELTLHNSTPAPVTPPYRQVGQGHTPLFTGTQELLRCTHKLEGTKQMKGRVPSCLYNFLETLKFSILILLFISPLFFNGQEKFSNSFYLTSQRLSDICLEPIGCFSLPLMN